MFKNYILSFTAHTAAPPADLRDLDMQPLIWCQQTNFPETWHRFCGWGSMIFWGRFQDIWSLCSWRGSCVLSSRSSAIFFSFSNSSQFSHWYFSLDDVNALQRIAECPDYVCSTQSMLLMDGFTILDFFFLNQIDHYYVDAVWDLPKNIICKSCIALFGPSREFLSVLSEFCGNMTVGWILEWHVFAGICSAFVFPLASIKYA